MAISIFFLVLFLLRTPPLQSTTFQVFEGGSSLLVEKSRDSLISGNGVYSAGFFPVGNNAFCFAIWFTRSSPPTTAWMANRDKPVNGQGSKLSLLRNGDLQLTDAGGIPIWNSKTNSESPVQLVLLETGNLVLRNLENFTLWQSFESPTDTLLPGQPLTRNTLLVSSRSRSNYSSGFYRFYFDNDNILRLLYDGPEISSVYWPDPGMVSWDEGRTTYNSSRIAVFNNLGYFESSDDAWFEAADFGPGPQRRLTLDLDGNVRMYSLEEAKGTWKVSWQAISEPCMIHGICGPNSLCSYSPESGRTCSCVPGFRMKNPIDWSHGCEPEFEIHCNHTEVGFLQLRHIDFYGYDIHHLPNFTFNQCRNECLQSCNCKAFVHKFREEKGVFDCYPKFLLLNGLRSPSFQGISYLKLPKDRVRLLDHDKSQRTSMLNCSGVGLKELDRVYKNPKENEILRLLLWFASGIGGVEMACFVLVWCLLYKTSRGSDVARHNYVLAESGFEKFSYNELKKATLGFTEEIGRGAGGSVYKGLLSDGRIAAIKRLDEANQGKAEFRAEVRTIGTLNHKNLIEMWGYCAEGKRRLLVYEYLKHGSLADNISSDTLTWKKRFEIAVGTAAGLAYLHEECLEWILHCDIKPQNILLDANYEPKVADFGLSKLLNRDGLNNSSFSRVRGTRGYMAPEWVSNLPITSKVDVYSYGIVVLEMVTGKSPTATLDIKGLGEPGTLVRWVRETKNRAASREEWIEEIVGPLFAGNYDVNKMEILVRVALQCVEDDRGARPTMSQVLKMLLCEDDDMP